MVRNSCCSCRGVGYCSQHPHQVTNNVHSKNMFSSVYISDNFPKRSSKINRCGLPSVLNLPDPLKEHCSCSFSCLRFVIALILSTHTRTSTFVFKSVKFSHGHLEFSFLSETLIRFLCKLGNIGFFLACWKRDGTK